MQGPLQEGAGGEWKDEVKETEIMDIIKKINGGTKMWRMKWEKREMKEYGHKEMEKKETQFSLSVFDFSYRIWGSLYFYWVMSPCSPLRIIELSSEHVASIFSKYYVRISQREAVSNLDHVFPERHVTINGISQKNNCFNLIFLKILY
jgi:hypothetical protein